VDAARRAGAAQHLAEFLGADHLILFVKDEETGSNLPAPGFPQTLPGGRAWRDLVASCTPGVVVNGTLAWPGGGDALPATAVAAEDGVVVVLLGGHPRIAACVEILPLLGLVAAVFRAEQRALASEGQAAVVRAAARQADALATALAHAQGELSAVLRQLREADRRKDEFIAMLAHELRNPLAAATHAVHVILSPTSGPQMRGHAADIVDRQTRTLSRLVDDLLDMSRITLGKLELRKEAIELGAVVLRAGESARPVLEAAGQSLDMRVTSAPWVLGDAVRLGQVVANLLANAARHAGPGATVTVELNEQAGRVRLSVRDTGAGIPAELLPRLFDRFIQGHQGLGPSAGGLGIGLALVHSIVEMHKGAVRAHSDGPGRGSEFVIDLPVTEPVAAVPAPVVAGPATVRRVLVVDDNVDSAEMLAVVLQQWGHEARLAHDGESALRDVERYHPDLVLLDIGLPGLSGYAVAERVTRAGGDRPQLVALTGYGQADDVARAREAGFDLHLLKPVDFKRLQEVLATPWCPAG